MHTQVASGRNLIYNILLSKGRMEALTDGIFAIAMTLLVLELKIPDLPRSASSGELLHRIREEAPAILSFVISFLYCGSMWIWHHLAMHFIRHLQLALVWLNLLFLMSISVMPFSAGLFGHFLQNRVAQEFYFGNMFVAAVLLLGQWLLAKKRELISLDDPDAARLMGQRLILMPLAMTAGMVATAFDTATGPYAFMLVVLLFRAWQKKQRRTRAMNPSNSSS